MAPSKSIALERTDSVHCLQLLDSQKEVPQRRLNLRVPSPLPFTSDSAEYRSLSSSPTARRDPSDYSPNSWSPSLAHSRLMAAEPTIAHSLDTQQHMDDTQKLREVNEQIKATLTELLNTESVRADVESRAWIQERLMDVEHQIRASRRRRSSSDEQFARKISLSLSLSPETSFQEEAHPADLR